METLHLIGFGLVVVNLILADTEALAWLRGVKPTLDAVRLHWLHRMMWAWLMSMIATGAVVVYPNASNYFSDTVFLAKMLFVGALIANGVLLGRLMSVATRQTFAETSRSDRLALVFSGGISFCAWGCAAVIGYFLL